MRKPACIAYINCIRHWQMSIKWLRNSARHSYTKCVKLDPEGSQTVSHVQLPQQVT